MAVAGCRTQDARLPWQAHNDAPHKVRKLLSLPFVSKRKKGLGSHRAACQAQQLPEPEPDPEPEPEPQLIIKPI